MCKSWVVPSQCVCVWCIWVAAYAQRRCCRSVYMSKDCVVSSQCMWLRSMYIDLIKRKINWFTASRRRVDAQKLNRVFAVYVYVMYMSCSACAKTLLLLCVYEQRLYRVFAVYVIAMHVHQSDKAKNRLFYCITQTYRCAKAESCLRSICVYVVYEFNMWIKRCYCSVCDCAACKSIWKYEKSIDLLHHVCLYVRKSWVVSLQYICICHIWAAACMQRRCYHSVYVQASTCWRSRYHYFVYQKFIVYVACNIHRAWSLC